MALNLGQLLNTGASIYNLFNSSGQKPNTPATSILNPRPIMAQNQGGFNLGNIVNTLGSLATSNTGLGLGALGLGAAVNKEPGEVLESRQFLRNQFTSPNATGDLMGRSVTGAQNALNPVLGNVGPTGAGQDYLTETFKNPTGLTDQVSRNVAGLSQHFQPLLDQQRSRGIEDIQQKFAAAFPGTVGAQGPEFGSLARYITDEALPREQAFLGQMGMDLQGRQQNAAGTVFQDEANRRSQVQDMATRGLNIPLDAAGTILNTAKPDPLAQLAGLIGSDLLTRGAGGGSGGGLGGLFGNGQGQPGSGIGSAGGSFGGLGNVTNALPQRGQLSPFDLAMQNLKQPGGAQALLSNPQAMSSLSSLLGGAQIFFDGAQAGNGLSGVMAMNSHGVGIPIEAISQGATPGITGAGGMAGMDFGMAGPGLMGPAGFSSGAGMASAAGSAGMGYAIGNAIGQSIDSGGALGNARYLNPVGAFSSNEGIQAAAGGATAGAAAGFAVGGPVGAVIGAIAGGIGGFTGERDARHERKEGSIAAETAYTEEQRPAAITSMDQFVQQGEQTFQQFTALRPQLEQRINQLAAQGSPQLTALAQELSQTGFWPQGYPPTSPEGITEALARGLRTYYPYRPGQEQNEETARALLYSKETGKFDPGMGFLGTTIQEFQASQQMLNKLRQLVGV